MSPRKSRYRVPEWKVQSYRDKGKKILFGPYNCPKCKQDKLRIKVDKQKKEVIATCNCGLEHSFKYVSAYDPVDYYSKLMDQFARL
jgi:transcription elongation factor Elf1